MEYEIGAKRIESFSAKYAPTSQRVLLTPGPFAQKNLLYVQEVGQYQLLSHGHHTERTNLASFLLVSVQAGSGSVTYGRKVTHVSQGQLFFIDCRKPHRYQSSAQDPWTVAWAHFDGQAAQGYYEQFSKRSPAVFISAQKARLDAMLSELLALNLGSNPDVQWHNARVLTDILTLVITERRDDATAQSIVAQVKAYLVDHYREEHTLESLAQVFHVSKSYLSHMYKDAYGTSPIAFLLDQRITQAKHLIRFTDMNVTEISQHCGFRDVGYFGRQFRRAENCSVSEFRARWRG